MKPSRCRPRPRARSLRRRSRRRWPWGADQPFSMSSLVCNPAAAAVAATSMTGISLVNSRNVGRRAALASRAAPARSPNRASSAFDSAGTPLPARAALTSRSMLLMSSIVRRKATLAGSVLGSVSPARAASCCAAVSATRASLRAAWSASRRTAYLASRSRRRAFG